MPDACLLILLGLFIGAFSTLIGSGGGFILTPVLMLIYPDLSASAITSISITVVLLNATSGSFSYNRMRRIDYKSALIFLSASIPGTLIGTLATGMIPRHAFNTIFAMTLVAIGLFMLRQPAKKDQTNNETRGLMVDRRVTSVDSVTYDFSYSLIKGVLISFSIGLISGLLGIGGGILHVPAIVSFLNFPLQVATATSFFMLMVTAVIGTVMHVAHGDLNNLWSTAILIGAGVVFGAQVGAHYSQIVRAKWIVRGIAAALLLTAIRLLFIS